MLIIKGLKRTWDQLWSGARHGGRPAWRATRPRIRTSGACLLLMLLLVGGCAKFNTYFNAKRSFDRAEDVRKEALKKHQDPGKPNGTQKSNYETAIRKSQKILDEYPGHSLTDDVLFLQGKAYHRLESYRQAIRKLNLLFQNYPATPYMEEALYLQALNYLLIGDLATSQDYLERLAKQFPKSKFQAETRKVSGDNAYAMKDWQTAADSYRDYLDLNQEVEERERVGLKLAQCYWELKDYYPAAEVLQEVSQDAESAEVAFRARLLRARVHVRMKDFEIVKLLVAELRKEAEIYKASGEVTLVEAEALLAEGKSEEAAPLVEGMPNDWLTPTVKARAGEILGNIYLERGEWEKARKQFQAALLKKTELDDPERVRRLNDNLKDYLAANQALPDAKGSRLPRLKLLQANAMLFGFDRPHEAARLYGEAAVDTAADSTVAARALYGAYVTYRNYLDEPDSAAVFEDSLQSRFPASPQAFEASHGTGANLLGYLLAMRSEEQAANLANLSDEERAALQEVGDVAVAGPVVGEHGMKGVRRRMVYLSRRPNLIFPPPEQAVKDISDRQAARIRQDALDAVEQARFDSLQTAGAAAAAGTVEAETNEVGAEVGAGAPPGAAEKSPEKLDPATEGQQASDSESAEAEADKKAAAKQEAEKKKKKDENWDFLR